MRGVRALPNTRLSAQLPVGTHAHEAHGVKVEREVEGEEAVEEDGEEGGGGGGELIWNITKSCVLC